MRIGSSPGVNNSVPNHRRIAVVLQSLDAALLREHGAGFGGGTAMALRFGEYRESVDIDFLVSRVDGYRTLRHLLTGPRGFASIVRADASMPEVVGWLERCLTAMDIRLPMALLWQRVRTLGRLSQDASA